MTNTLIHYAEIGLKKGNLSFFEKKLVENIKKSAEKNKIKLNNISRSEKRIFAEFDSSEKNVSEILKKVFGIKYFSFVYETEKDLDKLKKEVEKILKEFKKNKIKKIAFETKRADKTFPLTSVEINKELGEISNNLGLKVDYKNFEKKIFIEVTSNKIFIYTKKISGFGGLPVSTSGRVLVLLSGGIDSPVASWLMMKRGCRVDFLHFHTFKNNQQAFNSKIKNLVETLNKYQRKSKLYLVPYSIYEILTQGRVLQKYDLVFFKYFMLNFADKLVKENHYDAIVNTFFHALEDSRISIHNKVKSSLKTGGRYILEAFDKAQIKRNTGGPKDTDLLYSLEEINSDFQDFDFIHFSKEEVTLREGDMHNGQAVVIRFVGEKLG